MSVRIRVTRPCLLAGRPVPAGEVLRLTPTEAADALDSGRCELVDADDAPVLLAARREETARITRSLAHQQPPAGWPWHPL